MADREVQLNQSDKKRRDFILTGDIWKVLLYILIPIAMFNFLNYLFGVFDLKIVSMFPNDPKDSVAFFDEIKNAISAFGGGFAAGGTVVVAKLFGEGKINEARKNAGVVLILSLIISVVIIIITIFGVIPILRAMNFDKEVIDNGINYFYIQVATTALMAINVVFIGLEKAKGNSKTILFLNIAVAVVKVSLTLLFVYGFKLGIEWVALATLFAQLSLTIVALVIMFSKKNVFRIDIRDLSFKKDYIRAMFLISIPVIFGKFIFSLGKVIVNFFAAQFYGREALSALTVTYKANLGIGTIANSIEESEMGIISQNLGNKNLKRAFKTVRTSALFCLVITIFGILSITFFGEYAVKFFISPGTANYALKVEMALKLLSYERFSMITTAFIGVFLGGFYGFKMTKVSYFVNFIRLFIFRIPVLFLLNYVFPQTGYSAIGLTMVISNSATMILVMSLFIIFYFRTKRTGFEGMFLDVKKKEAT